MAEPLPDPATCSAIPVGHSDSPHSWQDYYDAVQNRPPRETLLKALSLFQAEEVGSPAGSLRLAVDLGCGEGRDTIAIARLGWRVLAIDGEPEAIARLKSRPDLQDAIAAGRLETQVQRFEQLTLPADVDLINASFCLQFCPPAQFPTLWQTLLQALRPGGRLCGQLLGDRDSWADYAHMNHHTRDQVAALLAPLKVEMLEEEAHPGTTALGEEKYWHLFHLVARKPEL